MMDKKELEIMEMEMIAGGIETPPLGDPSFDPVDDPHLCPWNDPVDHRISPKQLKSTKQKRKGMSKMMDKKELNVMQLDTVAGGNWLSEIGDFFEDAGDVIVNEVEDAAQSWADLFNSL